MRDRNITQRKPPEHFPRRPGGRLDRRRLGSQRQGPIRIDPGRNLGQPSQRLGRRPRSRSSTAPCRGMLRASAGITSARSAGRMEPDLVIYESTAADVGWDERRLRFLLARGLGWDCPIYRTALETAGVASVSEPRPVQASPSTQALGDPLRRVPLHDGRLPRPRRADLLGTGSPGRRQRRRRDQARPHRRPPARPGSRACST